MRKYIVLLLVTNVLVWGAGVFVPSAIAASSACILGDTCETTDNYNDTPTELIEETSGPVNIYGAGLVKRGKTVYVSTRLTCISNVDCFGSAVVRINSRVVNNVDYRVNGGFNSVVLIRVNRLKASSVVKLEVSSIQEARAVGVTRRVRVPR